MIKSLALALADCSRVAARRPTATALSFRGRRETHLQRQARHALARLRARWRWPARTRFAERRPSDSASACRGRPSSTRWTTCSSRGWESETSIRAGSCRISSRTTSRSIAPMRSTPTRASSGSRARTRPSLRRPDPLDDAAFFYFVRITPLEVGKKYVYHRYFRKDKNPVTIEVVKREKMDLPDGSEVNCLVLQPVIDTQGNVFQAVRHPHLADRRPSAAPGADPDASSPSAPSRSGSRRWSLGGPTPRRPHRATERDLPRGGPQSPHDDPGRRAAQQGRPSLLASPPGDPTARSPPFSPASPTSSPPETCAR